MSNTSGISSMTSTRLSGLASGLDTDSIITSLLKIDKMKVDREFRAKTKLEWKSDAVRQINSLLKTFRQNNMSVLKSDTNMLSAATYKANTVTMNTTTSAVSITANSTASAASMTIESITRLASNAQVKGNAAFSAAITTDTALSELAFTNALTFEGGQISFTINDVAFTFSESDTLADVINTVNESDAGVTMRYSSLSRGFYLTSNATGSASQVEIVDGLGNAFDALSSAFGIAEGTTTGQNALLSIDGTSVEQSANTFTIDGITYALAGTSGTAIDFTVSRDVDGIYEKISSFIDSYNTLITTLHDKVTEGTYSDFGPLTDAEKEAMTESQIEKWEEKAKSGILRSDTSVRSLLSTMRNAFYAQVESAGLSPSEIGLTTKMLTTNGEIEIDKDALKTAIAKNPDQVMKIFVSTSEAADATTVFNQSGLVTRISNAIASYTDNSTDVTLSQLSKQIDQSSSKLSDLEDWLATRQESYYQKFSRMEAAMAEMNSNSGWLSSIVSSWSASNG